MPEIPPTMFLRPRHTEATPVLATARRLAVNLVAYGVGIAVVSVLVIPAVLAPLRGTRLAPAAAWEDMPVIARRAGAVL